MNAEEVFAAITASEEKATIPQHSGEESDHREFIARFRHLVATMRAPENFDSALAEEMKLWNGQGMPTPETAALMYLWMLKDSGSLVRWAGRDNGNPKYKALAVCLDPFVSDALSGKRVNALEPFLSDPLWSEKAMGTAGMTLGRTADLDGIMRLKILIPAGEWLAFIHHLSMSWPWSEKSKFVGLAASENRPEMIVSAFTSRWREEPESTEWILGLLRDNAIDAEFRKKISQNYNLRDHALTNTKLPLSARFALLQNGDPQALPNQTTLDAFTSNDLNALLAYSGDLNFKFRNGKLDAAQVLARVEKEIPDVLRKSPDKVREIIFLNLIEENPRAAMPLLDDLPPADRSKAVLCAARTAFVNVDPDLFLDALGEVPADDASLREERLLAWTSHAKSNHERIDEEYVKWVRALPEGVDREMALYSLSAAVDGDLPELAASLRDDLKDADLKQRLTDNP